MGYFYENKVFTIKKIENLPIYKHKIKATGTYQSKSYEIYIDLYNGNSSSFVGDDWEDFINFSLSKTIGIIYNVTDNRTYEMLDYEAEDPANYGRADLYENAYDSSSSSIIAINNFNIVSDTVTLYEFN